MTRLNCDTLHTIFPQRVAFDQLPGGAMDLARSTLIVFTLLGVLTFWYVDNSHNSTPARGEVSIDTARVEGSSVAN